VGGHEANALNIWRINADGSGTVRLSRGKADGWPICSPDQKWVYYVDFSTQQGIRRVSLDGSQKSEAIAGSSDFHGLRLGGPIDISADGRTLAYAVELINAETPQEAGPQKTALLKVELGGSPRLLDANPHISGGVQFTSDGKAIAYPIREHGVDNLWIQPLDGSAGHKITNFASDQIDIFYWSPDGKNLGVLRRHTESDVVLLQESKQ